MEMGVFRKTIIMKCNGNTLHLISSNFLYFVSPKLGENGLNENEWRTLLWCIGNIKLNNFIEVKFALDLTKLYPIKMVLMLFVL